MIGNNIDFLMKYYGHNQTYLAKIVDVSQGSISGYLNNESRIKLDVANKIAQLYDISIEELMYEDLSLKYKKIEDIKHEQISNIALKFFPFKTSKMAEQNVDFNNACRICDELFVISNINELDKNISIYERAIDLYKKAWKESKIFAALPNCISTILLIYSMYNSETINIMQSIPKNKIITQNNIYTLIKDSLFKVKNKKFIDAYKTKQKLFFEKHFELVYEYIKELKQSIDYADLGDYYLALCCFFAFPDYNFSKGLRIKMTQYILHQQLAIDNDHARGLLIAIDKSFSK